jgi:hypothetical protein
MLLAVNPFRQPMPHPPDVDWTGVEPDRSPIAPLNATSFVLRLRRLSERAMTLRMLRAAFQEQRQHDPGPPRDTEQSSR